MVTIENCPICTGELQSNAQHFMSVPAFEVDVEGLNFRACALVHYAHCPACGVYVQSPRMTDDHINQYYANGSYRRWLGANQQLMDADENARASADAALLKKIIGEVESHLDIGSSRGYFLKHMGAELQVGVELNREYNQNPDTMLISSIKDSPLDEPYELVSAIHSLEHSSDPMASLMEMAARSSRYVVVEVPSEHSPGGWGRLAHTFHFPEETFFVMAEKAGLTIKTIYHTPHTFVLMEKS